MDSTAWWKEAAVYQVYPLSFQDSNGDGIGDLNGIRARLPYIRDLGIDVIWLSPVYASPLKDMGYDISDYRAINPQLGTMADWDLLLRETHSLGMKLVMDLVVNHTSDEHPWFRSSCVGGDHKDWYIWQPPKNGKEPNNWGAYFGGSCWEFYQARNEYYLHAFDKSQPDLNWTNPAVRDAIWDIMRFWLDKGCDGFRMDVINCISKEPGLPDVPITHPDEEFQPGYLYRYNGPYLHDYLQEMHDKVLKDYPNAFTVGETPGVDTFDEAIPFVKQGHPLQMVFNFGYVFATLEEGQDIFHPRPWKLTEMKTALASWTEGMQSHGGWETLFLENHDQPRVVTWLADDKQYRSQSAKMLALLQAGGRGTVFVYQGQEIGMKNPEQWSFEELRDVEEINYYKREEGKRPQGADMSDVLHRVRQMGRDNSRTPMQWDGSPSAGFSTGTPWIKVAEDFQTWNVKVQQDDSDSVLNFWICLLALRKSSPCLIYGRFNFVDRENEQVYAYERTDQSEGYLIVCSFCAQTVEWRCPLDPGSLLLSNYAQEGEYLGGNMALRPYEARLYKREL